MEEIQIRCEAAMSGGLLSPEEFRTASLELPLPGIRNRLIVGPMENGAATYAEEPCELSIGFEAEQPFDAGL